MRMAARSGPRTVAEPVTRLGLQKPMFPPAIVRKRPSVEIAGDIQRPSGSQPELHPEIDRQSGIVKKICLDGGILPFGTQRPECRNCKNAEGF